MRPNLSAVFDENMDDECIVSNFFNSIDTSNTGLVSIDDLAAGLARFKDCGPIAQGLATLTKYVQSSGRDSFDINAFSQLVRQIPRLRGQRVQWARALHLECILARHLAAGPLFDELAGIRAMTESDLRHACDRFCDDARTAISDRWNELRRAGMSTATTGKGADGGGGGGGSLVSKFADEGVVVGAFGHFDMFQAATSRSVHPCSAELFS